MKKLTTFIVLSMFSFLISGCFSFKKTYPEKHQFLLDVPQRSVITSESDTSLLLIRTLNVSPLYKDKGFVYLKDEHMYVSDFYNEFFIEPGPMLTEAVQKWLAGSGIFANVISIPGKIVPDYILEGTVTSLYGDYSVEEQNYAVIGIQFFLISEATAASEIVFQKHYQRKIPFNTATPQSLVNAWNIGLKELLTEFESDLWNVKAIE